jgi:hypothetical protein
MNRRLLGLCSAGVTLLSGCTEEVKRFDVDLQVTRAVAVTGGSLQYSYLDNLGIGDGSGVEQVQGLSVGIDATSVQFTVETVGGRVPGLGRSGVLPIVDNTTLTVHVLLAPVDEVGLISDGPQDLGGDACVAADAAGNIFIVGGTRSSAAGYVYDTTFALRSFGGVLGGVSGLGCGAFRGAVAVVGGCNDEVLEVQLIQVDGTTTKFPVPLAQACGAMAAPAADGGVWVVDGDGTVSLHDAVNSVLFNGELGAEPQAIEVTAEGNLVVLSGGKAWHVSGTAVTELSPALALGRRGDGVFILDGDQDIQYVDEDKAQRRLRGGVPAFEHFVVLSDDTVVGLNGTVVSVVPVDGNTSTLTARAHTAIVGLPGDTVVLAGAAGPGFDGFSRR